MQYHNKETGAYIDVNLHDDGSVVISIQQLDENHFINTAQLRLSTESLRELYKMIGSLKILEIDSVKVKPPEPEAKILNENETLLIKDVGISIRLKNCLRAKYGDKFDLLTIKELSEISQTELLTMRNVGRKSLTELKEIIHGHGFLDYPNK